MPVFALYRFHLEKIGRGSSDVFAETEDCEYNTLEEMIESRFPESGVEIQIGEIIETGQGDNRTSELVAHMTFVEAHSDNIVILNFQAIKTKTINNENLFNKRRKIIQASLYMQFLIASEDNGRNI